MTKQRRIWKTPKAGNIERLTLQTEDMPVLASNHMRVSVKSVGLNFADIFAITGLYSATPKGAFIPGLEYAGIVEEVGKEVTDFSVGDRVMGVTRFGGYVDTIDVDSDQLQPLPHDWSFDQGAAYLVQTLTAWYALKELGNLKPDQEVLIQSAGGGVGLQAMKLCEALNAKPIGFVSTQNKVEFLNSLGFEQCHVRSDNFHRQLSKLNLHPDLVLDAIGGDIQTASYKAMKPMGRLVVFGAAEFTPGEKRPNYLKAAKQYLLRPRYDVMDMISENKSVMAFNLIWLWDQMPLMRALVKDMMAVEISPPHVGHTFAFEDAHDAIQCLRSGKTLGKVVLQIA
ncbi:medium chain dehydrogenase/reductase family protein [Litoribrevibacter euphylliae]|uniref:Medium chain dehydrogenase/reductase family protein n=1 Tax=Litoribrevibacter euphylliae TaxID=1834034 RepID=A0ABV7HIQ2_9GAMM